MYLIAFTPRINEQYKIVVEAKTREKKTGSFYANPFAIILRFS
jgi:hypothetical protein